MEESGREDALKALDNLESVLLKGRPGADEAISDPEVHERYEKLRDQLKEAQRSLRELSAGRLSESIGSRGYTFGLLNNLQSNLLHLTWQAKQIASGDLTQRIDFLDEFSESFNKMTAALEENRRQLEERRAELEELNRSLKDEVEERRRAEERLAMANHKLKILSSVTRHDALNQLTVLQGYLELAEPMAEDAKLRRYMERMDVAADIIAELIDFGKKYEMLGTEGERWASLSGILAAMDPGPQVHDGCAGVEVLADPLLDKVFYNLYDNTLRHSGGASRVDVSNRLDGDDLLIVWQDDGQGVPESEKERIFERGVGKNTGLGLFLIKEILEISGIGIAERGTPGEGARFEMRVPAGRWRYSD